MVLSDRRLLFFLIIVQKFSIYYITLSCHEHKTDTKKRDDEMEDGRRERHQTCMLVACILLKRMKHTAEHDSTRCTATLQAAMHACTTLTACSYTRSHTSSLFCFFFHLLAFDLTQATLTLSIGHGTLINNSPHSGHILLIYL